MQDANTSGLVFGPQELVAYLSRSITLEPGDVITTGTQREWDSPEPRRAYSGMATW